MNSHQRRKDRRKHLNQERKNKLKKDGKNEKDNQQK